MDIREYIAAPGRRFSVDLHLTPSQDLLDGVDWTVDDIHMIGEAFAQLSTLYLEVRLHAAITQLCRRCLRPVSLTETIAEPFELPIQPDSDVVDPLPTILQMVQSVHDPHVVCSETCRGLCPSCGVNLNENPDHVCVESASDRQTLRDYLS